VRRIVGDFSRLVLRRDLLLPEALIDLFTVNRHMLRGGDSHAYLFSLYCEYGDLNIASDEQPLADSTRQNEHDSTPRSMFLYSAVEQTLPFDRQSLVHGE
jgi:hypothetical protein